MSSAISTRECPICLGKFRDPVVTPCGHVACEGCINVHIGRSPHPYEATCPICRAPFPTVLADLSTIPKKYHVFISSSLRRVFLAEEHDSSRAVIDSLKSEITTLKRDKESLSKDLLESRSIISHLSSTERAARLASNEEKERARIDLEKAKAEARVALNKAKEETRVANERLEELRAEYDKSQSINSSPIMNTKPTSGQVTLDSPSPNNIRSSSHGTDLPLEDLPIRPWPKRAKPRSMSYPIRHSRRDVNDHAGYRCCGFVLALVLGLVWYTGAKWANGRNGAEYGRQW